MKTTVDVAPPESPAALAREISDLPPGQCLIENGELAVHVATARQAPSVLREIGRLREEAFRNAGEGSGQALDLDEFDAHYLHLFLWNRTARQIAGGYRVGRTDWILPALGPGGLYTSTLFRMGNGLLGRLTPGLELGRSFVRLEYQKSYSPLLLLWRGIAELVARNPECRMLFGAVSISDAYDRRSQQLLVTWLRAHHGRAEWARDVRPLRPPSFDAATAALTGTDLATVERRILEIEGGRRGIPVLVRQYLKLGGKILAFNRDESFADVVDGLVVVDLLETNRRVLERYMGRAGVSRLHDYQAQSVPLAASA